MPILSSRIETEHIIDGAVTGDKIADGAVATSKIVDEAITNLKLALASVYGDVIKASAITSTKISDGAVETAKLTALAVTAAKIAAGAIIAEKIGAGAVTTEKLTALAVTAEKIAAGTITLSKLASDAIPPKTYYQDAEPASGMNEGDYWIDTDDNNKIYIYESGAWVAVGAAAGVKTFRQAGIPTAENAGDLWVDTDNDKLYRATAAGDDEITLGEWELIDAAKATGWSHGADVTKIDGGNIYTGTIIADAISVAELSAIAADLGTITAGLITGATIRTAASGSRIVMNADALIAYDDAEDEVFKVILTGDDVGDIIIGDFAGDKGIKWDKSAASFTIRGRIYGTDLIVDDGKRNTILSATAFGSNETGYDNVAIGIYTLGDNTDGDDNIGIGQLALRYNTIGDDNIALGHNTLTYNTVGNNNIAMGLYALYWNISGDRNIAIGFGALNKNRTGYYNTGVGVYALYNNTTGYHNVAIGYDALYFLEPTSKAITHFYDYSGTVAGTVRVYSSFHGLSTDDSVEITGTENYDGTYTITKIDSSNFYITATYVEDETTGWWQLEGEAAENTALGYYSGWMLDKGSRNTLLGFKSGYFLQAGSGNICIGYEAGALESGSNKLYIENSNSSTPLIYGEFDNNLVKIFNYLYLPNIRSGATQAAAGASAGELWKTSGHASLPNNVVMIGV